MAAKGPILSHKAYADTRQALWPGSPETRKTLHATAPGGTLFFEGRPQESPGRAMTGDTVFGAYDRAALDAQYDNRERYADHDV